MLVPASKIQYQSSSSSQTLSVGSVNHLIKKYYRYPGGDSSLKRGIEAEECEKGGNDKQD